MKWDLNGNEEEIENNFLSVKESIKKFKKDERKNNGLANKVVLNLDKTVNSERVLGFKTQKKEKVHNYLYKGYVDLRQFSNPYIFTRNRIITFIEEATNTEIFFIGEYTPSNNESGDDDVMFLEVNTVTAEDLNRFHKFIHKYNTNDSGFDGLNFLIQGDSKIVNYCNSDGEHYLCVRKSLNIPFESSQKIKDLIQKHFDKLKKDENIEIRFGGSGSGHIEPCFGEESDEPFFFQLKSKKIKFTEDLSEKLYNLVNNIDFNNL